MKKKGFTLIELLSVIAVTAILISIGVYVVINIIDNVNEKTYKVTINEIEKNSGNYLIENSERLFFVTDPDREDIGEDIEFQCITVENLVDYGFLNPDITKSYVDKNTTVDLNDYIYVERNKNTKTIVKQKYLFKNDENNICTEAVIADGNIDIIIEPDANTWSKNKKVTLVYKLKNLTDVSNIEDDYTLNYSFGNEIPSCITNILDTNTIAKTINLTNEEQKELHASIIRKSNDKVIAKLVETIDKIDNSGPTISDNNYTGDSSVRHSVTIPLKVEDSNCLNGCSGVNYESFKTDDISVKIDDIEVFDFTLTYTNNGIYNLTINNDLYNGSITYEVNSNSIFDNVIDESKNGNNLFKNTIDISFNNSYTINYNANGGSNAPTPTTYLFGNSDTVNISNEEPIRAGYTFLGWSEDKTASNPTYKKNAIYNRNIKKDITLYAVWELSNIVSCKCNNYELGTAPYNIVYSGDCNFSKSDENWKLELLTSGTLSFSANRTVDVFLVGGGGGGNYYECYSGGGGGGGYTTTKKGVSLTENVNYTIEIGAGGKVRGNGGTSYAFKGTDLQITAKGGYSGSAAKNGKGGNGGSGGTGTNPNNPICSGGGHFGNNGKNNGGTGGTGQGSTTCEFGEGNLSGCNTGVKEYGVGGSEACNWSNVHTPVKNTGEGGRSSGNCGYGPGPSAGASGIVIFRNAR